MPSRGVAVLSVAKADGVFCILVAKTIRLLFSVT